MDGKHAAPEQLNAIMGDLNIRAGATPSLEALPHQAAQTIQHHQHQHQQQPVSMNIWTARHEEAQRRFRQAAEAEASARRLAHEQRRQQMEQQNRAMNGHMRSWGQLHSPVINGNPHIAAGGGGAYAHPYGHPHPHPAARQQHLQPSIHGAPQPPQHQQQRWHQVPPAPSQPALGQPLPTFPDQLQDYLVKTLLPSVLPLKHETAVLEMGRQTIEQLIQDICPGGRLVPFGSLVNDLGLRHSDLDLCLVLPTPSKQETEEEEQEDTRTPREILEAIGRKLRRSIPQLYIQYKTHARIPIIKIYARRNNHTGQLAMWNKFVADISVGNVLAIHNTRLIKAYTGLEERYRYLVLFLKLWSSRRKINEAFHGTLSSYGWAIMAAHYLMNVVEPPVLPNLQEIERPEHIPDEELIEGYDTYFFNDPSHLSAYFTRQNESTLGQLIISFFAYFVETFDYKNDVISMRSKNLTKSDKGWTEDGERDHVYLCIEDPFKTDYNIGRVVQHVGYQVIREELQRAHEILTAASKAPPDFYAAHHAVATILEPGHDIVVRRTILRQREKNINVNPEIVAQVHQQKEDDKKNQKRILNGGGVQQPASNSELPVLKSISLKSEDFPPLK